MILCCLLNVVMGLLVLWNVVSAAETVLVQMKIDLLFHQLQLWLSSPPWLLCVDPMFLVFLAVGLTHYWISKDQFMILICRFDIPHRLNLELVLTWASLWLGCYSEWENSRLPRKKMYNGHFRDNLYLRMACHSFLKGFLVAEPWKTSGRMWDGASYVVSYPNISIYFQLLVMCQMEIFVFQLPIMYLNIAEITPKNLRGGFTAAHQDVYIGWRATNTCLYWLERIWKRIRQRPHLSPICWAWTGLG
ncbi:uncharacterized protein LOC132799253 isoform X2 [Ziziphus jujuba]|uniref:Uncharacterized protein LOC125420781 isoform X1 n=1 Tax=Ziziphus jujuba TaxID=326968 RepID=A0ABM3I9H6_ZIZJJ|nr:uncharacterized protein LOC125420781 isoform X1 [Ziziphus jujuba]XP_060667784.1 uncharacterized protein LOC132799253 isoform X2 [Ziziphus jujuba]